jgi:SAM-dependent methyltransferase
MTKCIFCATASKAAFSVKGYDVLDCISCGHRFAGLTADEQHIAEQYSDEYFTGGGAGYADYSSEAEILIRRGEMYAKLIRPHTRPGTILDVGAAAGYILKGFHNEGWTGIGIEPNASIASIGRDEFCLDIRQGTLESFASEERFDLVSMIQVAAHFYEPAKSFKKAQELLKPGGLLLIETWDRGSLSARVLGKHWHEYSPPTVLHWYSRGWLTEHLRSLGFERVDGGRPKKRISGGHVRSLLRYRLGDLSLLKLIPERVEFPYPSEDLFWALFKKT